ncbi:MAG: single-stranded DNA-binding protein [Bacteroidota bacterium]|jgi:single-strand DNA-binding protein
MKSTSIEKSQGKEPINKVILTGNLGRDPIIDLLGKGQRVARFSLATNYEYKNGKGELIKNTLWHNVLAWGDLALEVKEKLKKGDKITIEGKINYNVYSDKTGAKKSFTDIVANAVRTH